MKSNKSSSKETSDFKSISWRDEAVNEGIADVQPSTVTFGGGVVNSARRASIRLSGSDISFDIASPLKITEEDRQNPTEFSACRMSDASLLLKFLNDPTRKIDLEKKDDNGWTLLMTASAVGCFDIVKILIERGANLNTQDEIGQTALFCATFDGHPEVVELLLIHGANSYIADNEGILPGQLFSTSVAEEDQEKIVTLIGDFSSETFRIVSTPGRCCVLS